MLAVAAALAAPAAAVGATGELERLADPFGCLSPFNHGADCAAGKTLNGARTVEASPDGRHVYVASRSPSAPSRGIAAFSRDEQTGALTQLADPNGCVTSDGSAGVCIDGAGVPVEGLNDLALSPDGRYLYAASYDSEAVYSFQRNRSTGALSQLPTPSGGCIAAAPIAGCDVPDAGAAKLFDVAQVAVAPDGKNVYAISLNGGVISFSRDSGTGAIDFQSGANRCISDTGAGPCLDGRGLASPRSLVIDDGGRHVYVGAAGSGAIAVLDRAASGRLTQAQNASGCVSATEAGCAEAVAVDGTTDFAISPDGRFLHAAAFTDAALSTFAIERASGHLDQLPAPRGCVRDVDATPLAGCVNKLRQAGTIAAVEVDPDGRSLYLVSALDDAILVLDRNPRTAAVEQLPDEAGCISDPETPFAGCAQAEGLDHVGSGDLALTPGGDSLYHASEQDGALASFDREVRCAGKQVTLFGTAGRDRIRGTAGPDVIATFGGADVLRGRGGKDRLCGGAQADKLRGGPGRDRLLGGPGRDDERQ
jgi:6-phosphogluconolactonase (cycloisomerase 2 family)